MTCPGCGAAVRPKESWCSLCFHDLRPAEPTVNAVAEGAGEPGRSLTDQPRAQLIKTNLLAVDAQATELSAVIPRPASAVADESLSAGPLSEDPAADGERPKTWPCTCGEHVPIDLSVCPACQRVFLEELRGADDIHKAGPQWLTSYLQATRAVRLMIATFVAIGFAFAVTGLLLLFG